MRSGRSGSSAQVPPASSAPAGDDEEHALALRRPAAGPGPRARRGRLPTPGSAGTTPQPTSSPTATTRRRACRQAATTASTSPSTAVRHPGASSQAPARSSAAATQVPSASTSSGGPGSPSSAARSPVSSVRHHAGRRARCAPDAVGPRRVPGIGRGAGGGVDDVGLGGQQVLGDRRLAGGRGAQHERPCRERRRRRGGTGRRLPSAATRAPHVASRRASRSGCRSWVEADGDDVGAGREGADGPEPREGVGEGRGSGRPSPRRRSRAATSRPAPVRASTVFAGRSPGPSAQSTVRPGAPTTIAGAAGRGPRAAR